MTRARRALIEAHVDIVPRLAYTVARAIGAHGDDLEYALSDGYIALVACAARYVPGHASGATFRQFASGRVRGAVLDSIRAQRRARGWIRTWRQQTSGYRRVATFVPLERPTTAADGDEGVLCVDLADTATPSAFDRVVAAERRQLITIAPLSPREREVMERRLVLDTQQAVADAMGLTPGRICQLEQAAITKVRGAAACLRGAP